MVNTQAMPRRVLIVDDHPLVRDGLRLQINGVDDLTVCGEAGDVREAMKVADETDPDLAVIDISLKSGNGIELVKRLLVKHPRMRIVVSSMHDERIYAERALQAGAMGYVHKEQAAQTILRALRQVGDGRLFASDDVMQRLLTRTVGRTKATDEKTPTGVTDLSDRELAVLERIGRGDKVADIARAMNLSPKTIETYRDRIRQKLDIASSHDLQHYAFRWVSENLE